MATDGEGFQKNSMQDAPTEFPLDVNNIGLKSLGMFMKQVNKVITKTILTQNKKVNVSILLFLLIYIYMYFDFINVFVM